MSDSQLLVKTHFVQFHCTRKSDETQHLSFPMLVVHEGPSDSGGDQKWGWVFCHDEDNNAGLATSGNWRGDIGHGGEGSDASWSEF